MKALIVVDIQNDFLPGGSLAVTDGDSIIPIVNALLKYFYFVVATQDWHPIDHESYASRHPDKKPGDKIVLHGLDQVLWPDHCIQQTTGAEFSDRLDISQFNKIFQKGTDIHIDSYSGFFDNGKKKDTGLNDYLIKIGVDEVFIVGLATDYCVKYTAIDAIGLGFKTNVIIDATRAVNIEKGDYEKSMAEMELLGIRLIQSQEILR